MDRSAFGQLWLRPTGHLGDWTNSTAAAPIATAFGPLPVQAVRKSLGGVLIVTGLLGLTARKSN
jgi:hypothetical protein